MMKKNRNYRARIVDSQLTQYLETFGAVCVEGPKWCGKTWTSSNQSKSEIYIGDPVAGFQNRNLAMLSPDLVLNGNYPRLIDEWQEVPPIWDAVRAHVDVAGQKGMFILTGSATPNHKGVMHNGAGRIGTIRMRTMSLYESGDSSGVVSLEKLCHGQIRAQSTGEVVLKQLIQYIVRGGFPGVIDLGVERAQIVAQQYLYAAVNDDVFRIDGVKRDSHKMMLLLRSLARNESTTASNNSILKDIKATEGEDMVINTLTSYLDILKRLYITDDQLPFAPEVRSSVRIKQAVKRHLADPSLTCALLKVTPELLLKDLETLGFLFEALCERDLRIYASSFGAELYHYQDYRNNEIDAVIAMKDGSWSAIEIKLGTNQIDKAAANLLRIKELFEKEHKNAAPSALIVLCGMTNAAYQRPDGVMVVPITALKN